MQVFFVSTNGIAVQEIWFSNANHIEDASMIIESSKEIAGLPLVENAYEYETIAKLGVNDDELSDFKVKFRVRKEWVKEYSDNVTIKLNYYDNKWVSVESKYVFSDALYDYYESYPKKITYLSISADIKKAQIQPVIEEEKTNIIKETTQNINEAVDVTKSNAKEYLSNKNIVIYSLILGAVMMTLLILYYSFSIISKGEYLDNLKEAEDFIDEELAEGVSKKDIEHELEDKGWPKKVVEKLVHKHHLPPDTEVKIKSSIQSMRNNMMSDAEIKKALITQGWASDLIEELFEEFTS